MIEITDHGSVRELRLNRPPVNALNRELTTRLLDALAGATKGDARAVVLSGRPGIFSAGLDVPELLEESREGITEQWRTLYEVMRTIATSPIPIVAALTGHSPAGGAVLSGFCDYRIMAEGRYKIGLNEVQVGLPVPSVIQYATKRLVGVRVGEQLLVRGSLLAAAEALEVGLVDEVVQPDAVVPRAVEWAQSLLELPSHAMLTTRRESRADLVAQFDGVDQATAEETTVAWFSPETQRAMRALVASLSK